MNDDTSTKPDRPYTREELIKSLKQKQAQIAEGTQQDEGALEKSPEPETKPATFCYSLVLAEVIFQTSKGVSSQRVQLFSKSDLTVFPAARLGQLQGSASHQVQELLPDKKGYKALEVIILNIQTLGWMTDVEFWGSQGAVPTGEVEEAAPQAVSSNSDNVVPMHRP